MKSKDKKRKRKIVVYDSNGYEIVNKLRKDEHKQYLKYQYQNPFELIAQPKDHFMMTDLSYKGLWN